jgi:hypothetical protein
MITLLITLLAVASIGFMYGGFMAIIVTLIASIFGYFTGTLGALLVILLVAIGSGIQKFRSK